MSLRAILIATIAGLSCGKLSIAKVQSQSIQTCNGYRYEGAGECFASGPSPVHTFVSKTQQGQFAFPFSSSVTLFDSTSPAFISYSNDLSNSFVYTRDEFGLTRNQNPSHKLSLRFDFPNTPLATLPSYPDARGNTTQLYVDRIAGIRIQKEPDFITKVRTGSSPHIGEFSAWINHLDDPRPGAWRLYQVRGQLATNCFATSCPTDPALYDSTLTFVRITIQFNYATRINQPLPTPPVYQRDAQTGLPIGICDPSLYVNGGNDRCEPIPAAPVVCSVPCDTTDGTRRCSHSGQQCECVPPLLPVVDFVNSTILSCSTGQFEQYESKWPLWYHQTRDSPMPRGICMRDVTNGGYHWCRDYGGLGISERCSTHGWHVQYRTSGDLYPVLVDTDCFCDTGYSGARCQSVCYRQSDADLCLTSTTNICDIPGFRRKPTHDSYCEPNYLVTLSSDITLYHSTNLSTTVFETIKTGNQVTTSPVVNTLQIDKYGTKFEAGLSRASIPWKATRCFLDANLLQVREQTIVQTGVPGPDPFAPFQTTRATYDFRRLTLENYMICDVSLIRNVVPNNGQTNYTRETILVGLNLAYKNETNYDCTQDQYQVNSGRNPPFCAAPFFPTRVCTYWPRSDPDFNPCLYGSNPILTPSYTLSDINSDTLANPINFNSLGFDRHIVFWYGLYENNLKDTSTQNVKRMCTDSNTFRTTTGVCKACSPSCPSDQYCTTQLYSGPIANEPGVCRCKNNAIMIFNALLNKCVRRSCPAARYGYFCESVCGPLSADQVCNDGPAGDGFIQCANSTLSFDPVNRICVAQSCDKDIIKCSNRGTCITTKYLPYCMCDAGYDGTNCELTRTQPDYVPLLPATSQAFDECDCAVKWNPVQNINAINTLPAGLAVLRDFDTVSPLATLPLLGSQGLSRVGSFEQARVLCYNDALCSGFILYSLPSWWKSTNQVVLDQPVFQAVFLTNSPGAVINPNLVPTGVSVEYHTIDRFSSYPCADSSLDVAYYKLNYIQSIYAWCLAIVNARLGNGNLYVPEILCPSDETAILHWRRQGHLIRLSPRAGCSLNPVLYRPETYCQTSRCPSSVPLNNQFAGASPCGGPLQGTCGENRAANGSLVLGKEYVCNCATYKDSTNTGFLSLNGKPAFLGNACQFSTAVLCVKPGSGAICNDRIDACKPRLAFDGNFYAPSLQEVVNQVDFIPKCDCSGTPQTGEFCEISRCGANSGGCKTVSEAGGDCLPIPGGRPDQYQCVCQRGAIGVNCEIDASTCLFNGLKCSNQGRCLPADPLHSNPWCQCNEGTFGDFCQLSDCPPDVMIAGHGVCANRQLRFCYPPYSGLRCEIDECARITNGTVRVDSQGIPATCDCPRGLSNVLNNATVAQCWPQCPLLNGAVCGTFDQEPHQCAQNEIGQQRFAQCVCAQGYIQVPHPTLPGVQVCEKYCKNGVVPPGWDPRSPSACICSAATGFDTQGGTSPRCDHAICENQGVIDPQTLQCVCKPPWLSFDRCRGNNCGSGNSVVPWLQQGASSPYQCNCVAPYKPRFSDAPFDCAGTVCGFNGYLNPFFTANTPARAYCVCRGKTQTVCTTTTGCNFCSTTSCLNGGTTSSVDVSQCICPFPYVNGPAGLCENSLCVVANTQLAINTQCFCKPGFRGVSCSLSVCFNNGTYVPSTGSCRCTADFIGFFCDVPKPVILPVVVIPPSSSSSSTGTVAPVQPPPPPPPKTSDAWHVEAALFATLGAIVFGSCAWLF